MKVLRGLSFGAIHLCAKCQHSINTMKKALGGAQSIYCSNKRQSRWRRNSHLLQKPLITNLGCRRLWVVIRWEAGILPGQVAAHLIQVNYESCDCKAFSPWVDCDISTPISTKISKFEGICLVWVSNALQSSGKCLRIGMRMCVWVGGSCGYVIRPTATVELLQILIMSLINFSPLQISQLHSNGAWTSSPVPSHLSTFYYFYSLSHFQHMLQVCSTYQGCSAHSPALKILKGNLENC